MSSPIVKDELPCRRMNKELFEHVTMPEVVRQSVFQERAEPTRVYTDADFELTNAQRLAKVRQELAVVPVLGVIVPAEQKVVEEPQKPKTFGDLLLMLVGSLLYKTGEFMESFGASQKPSNQ